MYGVPNTVYALCYLKCVALTSLSQKSQTHSQKSLAKKEAVKVTSKVKT